jgi:hypothetical protein
VVTIHEQDHYCGPFEAPESRQKYDRLVAEWLANGRTAPTPATTARSVNEILAAYLDFARTYYVSNGQPNNEFGHFKNVLRVVRETFGLTRLRTSAPCASKLCSRNSSTLAIAGKTSTPTSSG